MVDKLSLIYDDSVRNDDGLRLAYGSLFPSLTTLLEEEKLGG
jgi:hypothetical protein